MIIHFDAGNDTNGNPRRIFIRIDRDGYVKQVWDEGYKGAGCVPSRYRAQALRAPKFETTPREYRALLRGFN